MAVWVGFDVVLWQGAEGGLLVWDWNGGMPFWGHFVGFLVFYTFFLSFFSQKEMVRNAILGRFVGNPKEKIPFGGIFARNTTGKSHLGAILWDLRLFVPFFGTLSEEKMVQNPILGRFVANPMEKIPFGAFFCEE